MARPAPSTERDTPIGRQRLEAVRRCFESERQIQPLFRDLLTRLAVNLALPAPLY